MTGWTVLGWVGITDLAIVSTMLAVAVGLIFIQSARSTGRRSDYREKR